MTTRSLSVDPSSLRNDTWNLTKSGVISITEITGAFGKSLTGFRVVGDLVVVRVGGVYTVVVDGRLVVLVDCHGIVVVSFSSLVVVVSTVVGGSVVEEVTLSTVVDGSEVVVLSVVVVVVVAAVVRIVGLGVGVVFGILEVVPLPSVHC